MAYYGGHRRMRLGNGGDGGPPPPLPEFLWRQLQQQQQQQLGPPAAAAAGPGNAAAPAPAGVVRHRVPADVFLPHNLFGAPPPAAAVAAAGARDFPPPVPPRPPEAPAAAAARPASELIVIDDDHFDWDGGGGIGHGGGHKRRRGNNVEGAAAPSDDNVVYWVGNGGVAAADAAPAPRNHNNGGGGWGVYRRLAQPDANEVIVLDGSPDGKMPAVKSSMSSSAGVATSYMPMAPDSLDDVQYLTTKRSAPQYEVLEIFPDAQYQYVMQLLSKYNNDVVAVVAQMADASYPKAPPGHSMPPPPPGAVLLRMECNNAPKWKYDYTSTESFKPTGLYIKEAAAQLLQDFPFLSKAGAERILSKAAWHYAVAHDKILTAVKGSKGQLDESETVEDAQYRRLLFARAGNPLDNEQKVRIDQIGYKAYLKSPRRSCPKPYISDAILEEEILFVQAKLDDYLAQAKGKTDRRVNTKVAVEQKDAVECSCCFNEVAPQDMVACREEGHLFCIDCLRSYAENQVFGAGNLGIDRETKQPALELKCCHSDGCASDFARPSLEKALPRKTMQKYDEIQFQISLEAAGINDICACSKCGFQAALPKSQKIFHCPVVDCRFNSCRECGEAAHIPLRCEEVEKEVQTKGRVSVEEAITQAKIRKCPKCGKSFIKSDGCNKIRCGCGTFVCYICRKAIKNYSHFCQVPHCTHQQCKGCPLWTKAEEDDVRAMREAGLKAAAVAEKQLQQTAAAAAAGGAIAAGNQKAAPAELKIDLESILKEPV